MGISRRARQEEADEDGQGYPFRGDILMSGSINYANLVGDSVKVDDEDSVDVGLAMNIEDAIGMTLVVVVSAERVVVGDDGSKRQRFSGDAGVGSVDNALWRGQLVPRMIFSVSGATIIAMPREIANELWPRHEVAVQGYSTLDEIPTGKEEIIIDRHHGKAASRP